MLGAYLRAGDFERDTRGIRALAGISGVARYFAQQSREFRAYPGTVTLAESLQLLRRKLDGLDARHLSPEEVIEDIASELRGDPADDLDLYPGITADSAAPDVRLEALDRFFRSRGAELRRILQSLDFDEGTHCVMLGGDAERLVAAYDLTHEKPGGFFYLSRQKMMSSLEEQTVLQRNARAVFPGGSSTRVNGPAPIFTRGRVWEDNSLLNSTVFELVTAAQHASLATGERFEDPFRRLVIREFRERTMQLARRDQPVLFGTPQEDVAVALRRAMDGDAFFQRTLEIFEEFHDEHLRNVKDISFVELGSIGSQPLLLYGMLEYLKSLEDGDPVLRVLTGPRQAMVRDVRDGDKTIGRIAVIGFSANRAWDGVNLGDLVVKRPPSLQLTHLIESFRTFDMFHDWTTRRTVARPRGPMEEAASYWVSLILRNAMVEGPAGAGFATAPVSAAFLDEGTSVWDEAFSAAERARAAATPTVAVDFDQSMADYDTHEDRFSLRPGFLRLLEELGKRGTRIVLMTGTFRMRLRLFFGQYPEVARACDLVITQENLRPGSAADVRRAYPGVPAEAVTRFLSKKPGLRKDFLRLGHRAIVEDEPLLVENLSELHPEAAVRHRVLLVPPYYSGEADPETEAESADALVREILSRLTDLWKPVT